MCGKQRRLAAAGTRSFGDYARTDQLVAVVPCGELSGRDAPLGLVEEDVGALVAHEERCVLKRLAVADADAEAGALSGREGACGIDPMDFAGGDVQRRTPQTGVAVALADVDDVLRSVGRKDEERLPAAADAQPLALADGVEMRAVVLADLLAVAYGVAPRGGEGGKAFGRRFAVGSGDFGIRCSRYSPVFGRKRAVRPGV